MGDVEDIELELASSNEEFFEGGVFVADEGFAVVEDEDSLFEVFESFDCVASTDDVALSVVKEEVLWCGEVVFGQVGPLFDMGGEKSVTTNHTPPSPFLEEGFAESFWGFKV